MREWLCEPLHACTCTCPNLVVYSHLPAFAMSVLHLVLKPLEIWVFWTWSASVALCQRCALTLLGPCICDHAFAGCTENDDALDICALQAGHCLSQFISFATASCVAPIEAAASTAMLTRTNICYHGSSSADSFGMTQGAATIEMRYEKHCPDCIAQMVRASSPWHLIDAWTRGPNNIKVAALSAFVPMAPTIAPERHPEASTPNIPTHPENHTQVEASYHWHSAGSQRNVLVASLQPCLVKQLGRSLYRCG